MRIRLLTVDTRKAHLYLLQRHNGPLGRKERQVCKKIKKKLECEKSWAFLMTCQAVV